MNERIVQNFLLIVRLVFCAHLRMDGDIRLAVFVHNPEEKMRVGARVRVQRLQAADDRIGKLVLEDGHLEDAFSEDRIVIIDVDEMHADDGGCGSLERLVHWRVVVVGGDGVEDEL